MENIIIERPVFFALLMFHLFVGFCGSFVTRPIKAKVLHGIFAVDLLLVSGLAVFFCITRPAPAFGTVVFYLLTFLSVFLCWFMYWENTIVPGKVYEMTVSAKGRNRNFLIGSVTEGKMPIPVILFDSPEYDSVSRETVLFVRLKKIRTALSHRIEVEPA